MTTPEEREWALQGKLAILEALAKAWGIEDDQEAAVEVSEVIRAVDPANAIGGLAWLLSSVLTPEAAERAVVLASQFERITAPYFEDQEREYVQAASRILRACAVEAIAPMGRANLLRYLLCEVWKREERDVRATLAMCIGFLRKFIEPQHWKFYAERCQQAAEALIRMPDEEVDKMVEEGRQIGKEMLGGSES